jgi:uncharacterized protein (DUF305 family)
MSSMKKNNSFSRAAGFVGSIALCAAAFTASAQTTATPEEHHHSMAHAAAPAASSPSTEAYQKGGEKMMKDMDGPYSGNADKDFVSHMIPHHEGAVSMAEVELKYGKDPEIRKLAKNVIKAQQQEIAFMKKWQARHAAK